MIIAFYRKRGYYVIVMHLTIMHLTIVDGRMITDDEVFPRLFSLIRQMHNLSKRNVKHSGMFLGRGRIIHILAMRDQPLSQRELADMANIKPGSLTEVLERLERDDLIKRERLANDRRVIHVRLTAKGRKAYQKLVEERHEFGNHLLEEIDQEDLARFVKVVNMMDKNLHRYYGDRLPKEGKGERFDQNC